MNIGEIMKTRFYNSKGFHSAVYVALWALSPHVLADDSGFFRIVGPTAVQITALTPDGYLTWTNAGNTGTYTIQKACQLGASSNWVDYVQIPVSNYITTTRLYDLSPPSGMVLIPAGSFTMGDTFQEGYTKELPTHTVQVSAFYMDQYDVTKGMWDDVYQWATNHGYSFNGPGSGKAADHPVQMVNWYDCVKWCNARSEKAGLTPVYYTDEALTQVY
jgi:formylglycine-generating enzyme required for sulfatase activity